MVKDGFPIVRCSGCGLVLRERLPTRAELDGIYASSYFEADAERGAEGYLSYTSDQQFHRANARRRLRRLGQASGRLLDVGAAAGFFVDEAQNAGWDASGIDVAETMVAWGQEHLGVPLELKLLADVDIPDASLDCITMWDYLEHALDPVGDVAIASRLLKPGGRLALSTGDVRALLPRVSLRRWHLLTPRHHNFYFDTRTLRLLLARSGFDVIYLGHPAAIYPARYLAFKLGLFTGNGVRGRRRSRLLDGRIGAMSLPANLWDIVSVVAVKQEVPASAPTLVEASE